MGSVRSRFHSNVPPQPSLTIAASTRSVAWGGGFSLRGELGYAASRQVTILSRRDGDTTWRQVATTVLASSAANESVGWTAQVVPAIGAEYMARSGRLRSEYVHVGVAPHVSLTEVQPGTLRVDLARGIVWDRPVPVLVQVGGSAWRTIAKATAQPDAASRDYHAVATIPVHPPPSAYRIRVLLTKADAGTGYLASSATLSTRGFHSKVPPQPALSISASAHSVVWGVGFSLRGELGYAPSRQVTILSRRDGDATWHQEATSVLASSAANGVVGWTALVVPAIGAEYMAKAGRLRSKVVHVGVAPDVSLTETQPGTLGVDLGRGVVWDKPVPILVQAGGSVWRTIANATAQPDAASRDYHAVATIPVHPPPGATRIRVLLLKADAGKGYLAASGTLAYRG